jgi:hypothetical protein
MARDPWPPLAENDELLLTPNRVPRTLITRTVEALTQSVDTTCLAEAHRAFDLCLHASILPCLILVAEYSELCVVTMIDVGFERRLLTSIACTAMSGFQPPLSRSRIFLNTVMDWLTRCIGED